MHNYINYFTEIEEHFQRRRGSILLLSTLDWALIDTWREAGVPLAAVLRGIDTAFDKYEARQQRMRMRKINGLAWCAQAVMEAVEEMQEAAVGGSATDPSQSGGLERERIAQHLNASADALLRNAAALPALRDIGECLQELARQPLSHEDLERRLTTLEEKLFATLLTHTPIDVLDPMRAEAARELAPYRSRMQAMQIRQIEQQFLRRRLLEHYALPRISLFYMKQGE